ESLDVSGVGDRAILQAELDAEQRGLLPGDTLRFRVEAWDNAPVPHVGRSRELALRLLSREELRAAARDATQALATAADSVSAEQRRLADRTADLAQERSREAPEGGNGRETAGRQAGALPFDASQRADALARREPEAARRSLQRLAEAQQQLRQELERSRELFRRAAVEGALSSLAADAEDLRRRQDDWNQGDARRADSAAAAAQRDLAARADSLAQDLERTGRDLVPPGSEQLP